MVCIIGFMSISVNTPTKCYILMKIKTFCYAKIIALIFVLGANVNGHVALGSHDVIDVVMSSFSVSLNVAV